LFLKSKNFIALVYVVVSVPSSIGVRSYGFLTVRELALFLKSKNFIALVYVVVSVPSSMSRVSLRSCERPLLYVLSCNLADKRIELRNSFRRNCAVLVPAVRWGLEAP